MSDGFEEILGQFDYEVQELARAAKGLISEVYPDVVEVPWVKQKIIGYGVGPKKMSEHFCYLALFKSRINLGFYYGAELPDPDGLLEGTGKLLRHVKISSLEQLKNPSLQEILKVSTGYLPRLK
jgi:hypothetical protein